MRIVELIGHLKCNVSVRTFSRCCCLNLIERCIDIYERNIPVLKSPCRNPEMSCCCPLSEHYAGAHEYHSNIHCN